MDDFARSVVRLGSGPKRPAMETGSTRLSRTLLAYTHVNRGFRLPSSYMLGRPSRPLGMIGEDHYEIR